MTLHAATKRLVGDRRDMMLQVHHDKGGYCAVLKLFSPSMRSESEALQWMVKAFKIQKREAEKEPPCDDQS